MLTSIPTFEKVCSEGSHQSTSGRRQGRFEKACPIRRFCNAAEDGRVLVSGDIRTMSVHFKNFVASRESPGVLLIPSARSIGAAIEGLLFVWLNWTPGDLHNQVQWLP
jgi:hypothetical protein